MQADNAATICTWCHEPSHDRDACPQLRAANEAVERVRARDAAFSGKAGSDDALNPRVVKTVEGVPREALDRPAARDPLVVMGDVQEPSTDAARAEDHRQMARAAIRVALRHGVRSQEIEAEYEIVKQIENEADRG